MQVCKRCAISIVESQGKESAVRQLLNGVGDRFGEEVERVKRCAWSQPRSSRRSGRLLKSLNSIGQFFDDISQVKCTFTPVASIATYTRP